MVVKDVNAAAKDVVNTSVYRADFVTERDDALVEDLTAGRAGIPAGLPLLVVKRGPNAGSFYSLNRPVTAAGRHPGSDIFCDDVTVSRRHAEFRCDEEGVFRIVDLGSLNGTYVNCQLVDSAVLAHGDEVQLGTIRLVFMNEPLRRAGQGDR